VLFIGGTILLLYAWARFIPTGYRLPIGEAVTDMTAGVTAVISLLAFLLCLWLPKKYLELIALAMYLLTAIMICLLIITSGGLSSPFIAAWALIALFAGLFGVWMTVGATALVVSLLAYSYAGHADVMQHVLTQGFFGLLPIALGLILWHRQPQKKTDKSYSDLAHKLSNIEGKSDIVINTIDDGVMAISRGGTIELINPSAQALIGWNQGDALGLSWQSVLKLATSDGKDVSEADNPIAQALQNNKPTHSDVLSLRTSSDKLRLVSIASSPVGQSGEGVIVIFRDITKEKAEEREQAEFISTASHEMRTPVASIEGYLGLALNPATANIDEKARDFITKAHESAQHLGRLFQDLLDISKAEDGRLKNEPHVIDVVAYVADIFEGLKPKATEKGLRYFYKPNPSLEQTDTERKLSPVYYADVDPDHFREITANLIENAIKYTLEGEVIVDVTGDDQTVTVSVRDSGIGIPTEDIPHLFQKFYRVDNTDTREIGGTGLGLYLSRRLAEAMSGNLRVESEYKKGSTFFLDIPRMSHEGALEKMRQVSDVTDAPEQIAPPAPTPPVQPPAPSAQPATPNVATAPTPQSQTPSVTPISQPTQPAATARAHISVPDRSGFIKKP
jgi:PAS domain S-box-containing protein